MAGMIATSPQGVPLLAVSGAKNCGKTTLITHVLPLLRQKGLRVGVLKHDGHAFEPDTPGRDSHRIRLAGAELTAVFDKSRYMLVAERPQAGAEELLGLFRAMDLILLEGFKDSAYQKIELVREGISSAPSLNPAYVAAICTDVPGIEAGVPVFDLNDYAGIAGFVIGHIRAGNSGP